jgi:NADH dehydrogenase FAD-containing subunit
VQLVEAGPAVLADDLAPVTDPRTGHVPPPLAQVALQGGQTVARNLDAELEGRQLEPFTLHDKGLVVTAGTRQLRANGSKRFRDRPGGVGG